MTELSIVIPHYGDPEPTLELLRQLREQDPEEVIVVDDASPIPFPAETAPDVRVLRREANGGFGSAVNTGLRAAAGERVLVLNSDLCVPEGLLRDLQEAVEPWGQSVASPDVVYDDGTPQWVGRHRPTVRQQAIEWLTPLARWRDTRLLHEAVGHDTRCTPGRTVPVDWVFGACMLLPRRQVLEIGGFDERFFMNCEEVDLQRRLHQHGIPSIFLGTVQVVHASGGSSNPALRRRWLVASRFLYARKWGGERRLRAALRAATVVNLAHQLLRRAAGRDVAPLRTFREEWRLTGLSERGANQ